MKNVYYIKRGFRITNPKEQVFSTLIGTCNSYANNGGFVVHVKEDRIANPDLIACGLQIRKSLIFSMLIGICNPDANNGGFVIHEKADKFAKSRQDYKSCYVFFRIANPKEQVSSTLIGIYNPDVNNGGFVIHVKEDRIANPDVITCGLQIRKSLKKYVYLRNTNPQELSRELKKVKA